MLRLFGTSAWGKRMGNRLAVNLASSHVPPVVNFTTLVAYTHPCHISECWAMSRASENWVVISGAGPARAGPIHPTGGTGVTQGTQWKGLKQGWGRGAVAKRPRQG